MANLNAAGSQSPREDHPITPEQFDQPSHNTHGHLIESPQSRSAEDTLIDTLSPRRQQRQHAQIKRRSVHAPPTTSAVNGDETTLSPIVPSPLRIRKTKPSLQLTVPVAMKQVRLLVASLGNPPPYHTTRHSAGHIILKNMVQSPRLPALAKNKALGNGLVSVGAEGGRSEYTFWQSTSMMNVSGAGVMKAWKQFCAFHNDTNTITGLVILHDELESNPGTVKLRRGESSPKGHNGIKSVQSSLKSAGLLNTMNDRFIKVAIGIGRPVSRERDDVSAWVLGQVTQVEKPKLEAAAESVLTALESEISKLGNS